MSKPNLFKLFCIICRGRLALIMLLMLLVSATTLLAQEQEFKNTPLDVIDKEWSSKTIDNVINGSLGIMLERFDQTWPTWMIGAVRNTMEKGLDKEVLEEETELTVIVDAKNGYVSVGDGGTDGEYMSACYWNRSNGHKLLAVLLGKPTDPCIEVLCTYDYDPQKRRLTPEPDILKGYRWGDKGEYQQIFCQLPKTGKNILVNDWSGDDGPVQHTFTWDGMKPVYSKTEPLDLNDGLPCIPVNFKGSLPNIKDFVTALLSPNEDDESMGAIRDAWNFYKNGMKQMPGEDLIVDVQNGYVGFESTDTDDSYTNRQVIECCNWNYTDNKYKLVAITNNLFQNGQAIEGQYTGIEFYKYDNTTRQLKHIYANEVGIALDPPSGCQATSYALPRQGKTIVYTYTTPSGKIQKRLTWNGSKFVER